MPSRGTLMSHQHLQAAHTQEQAPGAAEEEALHLAAVGDFQEAAPAEEADKFHLSELQK